MCDCTNVEVGSYDNQVELIAPNWSIKKVICVDKCLVDEVKHLWSLGIETNGCCCGHNEKVAYIGVYDKYIDKMLDLGYVIQTNNIDLSRRDSFYAKSVDISPEMVEGFCWFLKENIK